jgi:CRP/FNR family cyclic AMP-dependent transcriptional regulator
MTCDPDVLRSVPLFALLDAEETAVLAAQVELKELRGARADLQKRRAGRPGLRHAVRQVRVSTVDEDQQEVVVDEPRARRVLRLRLDARADAALHTNGHRSGATTCLEVSRDDIAVLLERKPDAGMDLLTALGASMHAAQEFIRHAGHPQSERTHRRPRRRSGEHVADGVARFGGSWTFIIAFGVIMVIYADDQRRAPRQGMGSVSLHPAQSVPVDARGHPGAGDHDEPESPGHQGPLRGELDFDVNRRAASDIQGLARKLNLLDDESARNRPTVEGWRR